MEYRDFIDPVSKLEFIEDVDAADSMVKAVLGILASRIEDDEHARLLAEALPAPLSYERLRGHQAGPTPLKAEDYSAVIADQFGLDREQADRVIGAVLQVAWEALPKGRRAAVMEHLPTEWQRLVERA